LVLKANYCFAESSSKTSNPEFQQGSLYAGKVIVTATRLEEPIEKVPVSATVITKEQIEKKHAITIDEVLREVPGLHISRFGTIGEESFPRLRGSDNRHLLVMIDGVVVNPAFNDIFDFADYHVDNIERIEIIRGNYSALYGSDAIGGIINSSIKDLKFVLSGSRTDSEGDFDRDQYENNTFSANINYNVTKDSSLKLASRYIESKKEIAVLTTAILPPPQLQVQVIMDQNYETRRKTSINSLSFEQTISDIWDFNLSGSFFYLNDIEDDEQEENVPQTIAFFNSETESKRYTVGTQHNFYIKEMDTITIGFDYEREEVKYDSNTNFTLGGLFPEHETFEKHRTNVGYYLQNIFNWEDRWIFIAGVRGDHYYSFEPVFSPKVSTSYLFKSTKTKLKGSYGQGFHAPSFDQLYSNPMGNKNLDPERTNSYEVGFDQSIAGEILKIGAVYFEINYRDKIIRNLNKFKYVNAEKAMSRGVESYLSLTPINGLYFNVTYTFTETKNKKTREELKSIPKHMLNLNINYDITKSLNINLDINHVGSEFIDAGNIIGLDGEPIGLRNPEYTKVDLAASYVLVKDWNFLKNLTLFGNIMNLFDEEYNEVTGAPSPGIHFLAGLKGEF
jgi:vitamin B12 transporter